LSITWQSIPAGNYLWEYYDLNGKLLKQEKHIMHAQGSQEVPSLGVAGMYLLRIQDASGKASKTLRLPMLRN
jgi:predicted secreted protein